MKRWLDDHSEGVALLATVVSVLTHHRDGGGMNAEDRIIDRDVDFYQNEVEVHQARLRGCLPWAEELHQERLERAQSVVRALKRLRTSIDKEP